MKTTTNQENLINLINLQNSELNSELIKNDQDKNDQEHYEQNPVSELQMHKILYLAFGEFYRKYQTNLFSQPKFAAWTYGPVELDYREFLKTKDQKLLEKFIITVDSQQLIFLKKLIKQLLKHSVWHLVNISHTSKAWYDVYRKSPFSAISLTDLQTKY